MIGSDLARIVDALSPCKNIRLVADDVEYDSVEEFIKESKGKTPNVFKITAYEPYLKIEFYRSSARLYVSTSDLTGSGLYVKLVSQIKSCERQPWVLYSFWYAVLSTWAIQLLFVLPTLKPFNYLELWFIITNLIWVLWIIFVRFRKFSLVHLLASQDPRTFWQRNSDNAFIALFSAMLGAVGGVVATKGADRIWPSVSNATVAEPTPIVKIPIPIPPSSLK